MIKKTTDYKSLSFFVKANHLQQAIESNTRNTHTTATRVDLAITNCKYVARSGTLPVILSDHQPIYVVKKKGRDNRPKETFRGRSL